MIPSALCDTLRRIHSQLDGENVQWALVGSCGLAIRGAPIVPKDIDLMTDKEGAYRLEQLLLDFVVSPVSIKTSDRIESHFGILSVDGVKVEIMGDFRIRLQDGGWHGPPDFTKLRETRQFKEMSIPVLSLEWEYDTYSRLQREDRAEMVRMLIMAGEKGPQERATSH